MSRRTFVLLNAVLAAALLAGCGGSDGDHNAADVTFATDMIPHHRQAVEMADFAESRSSNPEVLELAAGIRDAQDPEIATMSGWLEEWGEPLPEEMDGMARGGMPGMMSEEQLAELEAATGTTFDEQFLEMMIDHHTGAVQMAQTEQADGQFADAIALAEQIEESQTAEIATMEELFAA